MLDFIITTLLLTETTISRETFPVVVNQARIDDISAKRDFYRIENNFEALGLFFPSPGAFRKMAKMASRSHGGERLFYIFQSKLDSLEADRWDSWFESSQSPRPHILQSEPKSWFSGIKDEIVVIRRFLKVKRRDAPTADDIEIAAEWFERGESAFASLVENNIIAGKDKSIEPLSRLLMSTSFDVRRRTLKVIAQIGDRYPEIKDSIRDAFRKLPNRYFYVHLPDLPAWLVNDQLDSALSDTQVSETTQLASALENVFLFSMFHKAWRDISFFEKHLDHKDPRVFCRAAHALTLLWRPLEERAANKIIRLADNLNFALHDATLDVTTRIEAGLTIGTWAALDKLSEKYIPTTVPAIAWDQKRADAALLVVFVLSCGEFHARHFGEGCWSKE